MSFILMLLLSLARSCVRLHLASMVTHQLQYSRCHSSGNHSFRRARTRVVFSQTQVLALHVAHLCCSTTGIVRCWVSYRGALHRTTTQNLSALSGEWQVGIVRIILKMSKPVVPCIYADDGISQYTIFAYQCAYV